MQDIPDVVPVGDRFWRFADRVLGLDHGPITAALRSSVQGPRIGHVHLRHLNPLPKNLGDVLMRYDKVLVPEMNMGQLVMVLRAKYLVDAQGYNKIQGKPFKHVRNRTQDRAKLS